MGKTITQIRLDFPPDPSKKIHTWIDYIHGPEASIACKNSPRHSAKHYKNSNVIEERPIFYPNPINKTLHVSSANFKKNIKVFNFRGVEIMNETLKQNENQINVSRLAKGIYIVRIINLENHTENFKAYKIVKE